MKRTNLFPHISLHRILGLFFNFGVLGNQWTVKKNGKSRSYYSFSHRENVDIDFDKKFNVHLGLRKELNLY